MAGNLLLADRPQAEPLTRVSLLEELRETDNAEAWRTFVDRYSPLVYGYCRKRGLQESDARDVTQNVFLAVSRAMRSFTYDRSRGRFRSWLGTITCREIRRHLSWVNRLHSGADNGGGWSVERHCDLESAWESECTRYLFHQAMRRARPTFATDVWQAFELTWLRDEAPADVAQKLDRPIAWVYKAKFQVLRRLREQVELLADDVPARPK